MRWSILITLFAALMVSFGSKISAEEQALEDLKPLYKRPLFIPFPPDKQYSPQLITLGKKLFFDPRLSSSKTINCATCHNPSFGFEAPVDRAIGEAGTPLGRHAPTTINMAWVKPYFWDGRAKTLEEQAAGPITAPVEMNSKFSDLVPALKEIDEYNKWFNRIFPEKGVTRETILTAIATYERSIVTKWAPFDHWVEGDKTAISEGAKNGFLLFNGKAGCANCRIGWNMTDNKFHDIGAETTDIGLAKFEPDNPLAMHAFKTPGLRNLTQRAPFTHNGSLKNLEDVVRHYETGGIKRPSLSPLMQPFELNDQERKDLVDFLKSLTADNTATAMPVLPN